MEAKASAFKNNEKIMRKISREKVGERIKALAGHQGSLKLSKKAGLSNTQLIKIVNGVTVNPGIFTLEAIAHALDITLHDLLHGDSEDGELEESDPRAMLTGQFMRELGLKPGDDAAIIYHITDDIMAPTLSSGSVVVIDTDNNQNNGLNLIRIGKHESVRRIVNMGADYQVICDNPQYPSQTLSVDSVEILGRVVLTMNINK